VVLILIPKSLIYPTTSNTTNDSSTPSAKENYYSSTNCIAGLITFDKTLEERNKT